MILSLVAALSVLSQTSVQLPGSGSDWLNVGDAPPSIGKAPVLFVSWSSTSSLSRETLARISKSPAVGSGGLQVVAAHLPEFEGFGDRESIERCIERWRMSLPVLNDVKGSYSSAIAGGGPNRVALISKEGAVLMRGSLPDAWSVLESEWKGEPLGSIDLEQAQIVTSSYEASKSGFDAGRFGYSSYMIGEPMTFVAPEDLFDDSLYLEGIWKLEVDAIQLAATEGVITFKFVGSGVSAVIDTEERDEIEEEEEEESGEYKPPKRAEVFEITSVMLDGKPIDPSQAGRDLSRSEAGWTGSTRVPAMLEILRLSKTEKHTLSFKVRGCGARVPRLVIDGFEINRDQSLSKAIPRSPIGR